MELEVSDRLWEDLNSFCKKRKTKRVKSERVKRIFGVFRDGYKGAGE